MRLRESAKNITQRLLKMLPNHWGLFIKEFRQDHLAALMRFPLTEIKLLLALRAECC